MIDFITAHKDSTAGGSRWGVEPMCVVLSEHGIPISASTYYEWVAKSPTGAQRRDEDLVAIITAHRQKRTVVGLGSRKMWLWLRRDGVDVAPPRIPRRPDPRRSREAPLRSPSHPHHRRVNHCFRVERHRDPRGDVPFDDGLGVVIHDRAGNATKYANARRWQSQNVARSIEVVKQVKESRECESVRCTGPRRPGRRDARGVLGQVLPHGSAVDTTFAGDLGIARSCRVQGTETADLLNARHRGLPDVRVELRNQWSLSLPSTPPLRPHITRIPAPTGIQ